MKLWGVGSLCLDSIFRWCKINGPFALFVVTASDVRFLRVVLFTILEPNNVRGDTFTYVRTCWIRHVQAVGACEFEDEDGGELTGGQVDNRARLNSIIYLGCLQSISRTDSSNSQYLALLAVCCVLVNMAS